MISFHLSTTLLLGNSIRHQSFLKTTTTSPTHRLSEHRDNETARTAQVCRVLAGVVAILLLALIAIPLKAIECCAPGLRPVQMSPRRHLKGMEALQVVKDLVLVARRSRVPHRMVRCTRRQMSACEGIGGDPMLKTCKMVLFWNSLHFIQCQLVAAAHFTSLHFTSLCLPVSSGHHPLPPDYPDTFQGGSRSSSSPARGKGRGRRSGAASGHAPAPHISSTEEGHKATCHRCGNIRRDYTRCVRCPYTFCNKCTDKMIDEHGQQVFVGGCPVVSKYIALRTACY
jgi:hypothetical protein